MSWKKIPGLIVVEISRGNPKNNCDFKETNHASYLGMKYKGNYWEVSEIP